MRRKIDGAATFIFLIIFFNLISVRPAYAYLDISYAGYALQLLIGVLFGVLYIVKMRWRKIVASLKVFFAKARFRNYGK
jgi:hypothetical protein